MMPHPEEEEGDEEDDHRETSPMIMMEPLETEPCIKTTEDRDAYGALPFLQLLVRNGLSFLLSRGRRPRRTYGAGCASMIAVLFLGIVFFFLFVSGPWSRTNKNDARMRSMFMSRIQHVYRHEICSGRKNEDDTTSCGGSKILSFDCTDGVGKTLVADYLQEFHPELVCTNEIVSAALIGPDDEDETNKKASSPAAETSSMMAGRSPIQMTLDDKYDIVLLDIRHYQQSSSFIGNSSSGDKLVEVWKKMLTPNGVLAVFGIRANSGLLRHDNDAHEEGEDETFLFFKKEEKLNKRMITVDTSIEPFQSTAEISSFMTLVKNVFTLHICNPMNKEGWFCHGNVLSLACGHPNDPGLRLVQDYLHGKTSLFCADNIPSSEEATLIAPREIHQQVPVLDLFQERYELIILDGESFGKTTFPNLEFWRDLLSSGGMIAIEGTLVVPTTNGTDAWGEHLLDSLHLQMLNTNPLIVVDSSQTKQPGQLKVMQDTGLAKEGYEVNEGSLGEQIQISPMSNEDRYTSLYQQATKALLSNHYLCSEHPRDEATSCPLKVLSFGCSYGFEMKTLADSYLTGKADIYGVDVNDPVVERAQMNVKVVETNKMIVLDGKTDPASNYGPFDAVFANSVLCYNPASNAETVREKFPFESFTALLDEIDVLVKVGGLLSLANTNYRFTDTALFSNKYKIYEENDKPTCNQSVWLLAAHGDGVLLNPGTSHSVPEYCLFLKVSE